MTRINRNALLFVLIAFIAILVSLCVREHKISKTLKQAGSYEFLVQQWGPSFCTTTQCIQPLPGLAGKGDFTLHGLWPMYPDPNYPQRPWKMRQFCWPIPTLQHVGKKLNIELSSRWPTLIEGQTNEDFLLHQMRKHGSCSKYYSDFVGKQAPYFWASVGFTKQYGSLRNMLEEAGIAPSGQPRRKEVYWNAIYDRV